MKKLLIAFAIVALAPIAQASNNNGPSWESHNWSQSSWVCDWFKKKLNGGGVEETAASNLKCNTSPCVRCCHGRTNNVRATAT